MAKHKSLGTRLLQAIDELKISQASFAKAGKINPATLTGYLSGERGPKYDVLANWVKTYTLSAHWLLTGEGEMFDQATSPTLKDSRIELLDKAVGLLEKYHASNAEIKKAILTIIGEAEILASLAEEPKYKKSG